MNSIHFKFSSWSIIDTSILRVTPHENSKPWFLLGKRKIWAMSPLSISVGISWYGAALMPTPACLSPQQSNDNQYMELACFWRQYDLWFLCLTAVTRQTHPSVPLLCKFPHAPGTTAFYRCLIIAFKWGSLLPRSNWLEWRGICRLAGGRDLHSLAVDSVLGTSKQVTTGHKKPLHVILWYCFQSLQMCLAVKLCLRLPQYRDWRLIGTGLGAALRLSIFMSITRSPI